MAVRECCFENGLELKHQTYKGQGWTKDRFCHLNDNRTGRIAEVPGGQRYRYYFLLKSNQLLKRKTNPHYHSEGWSKKFKSNNYYYEKFFAMNKLLYQVCLYVVPSSFIILSASTWNGSKISLILSIIIGLSLPLKRIISWVCLE